MSLFFALYIFFLGSLDHGEIAVSDTHLVGVYKGRPLFIKNAYDPVSRTFCVEGIEVNNRPIRFPARVSAIKVDFAGIDLYAPVTLKIIHSDSCEPIVINPDAIFYHSLFSFKKVTATDTLITWETVGEKKGGVYVVEKIETGLWQAQQEVVAEGHYAGGNYKHIPSLEQGSNKFRIKYVFPNGEYLYSQEIDMHFYPDPVTFEPKKTGKEIHFSRSAFYEIYDAGSTKVLDGTSDFVDVSVLPDGDYVIYFDGDDPGMFVKESPR
ncbi:hypothetical protein [Marinoscillum sp. MHG1-6]|uniref:hypothetical protein n=1 Tax=Marinoscillum sp. MHG1-6 TaxID=2959627 RepID=UPI002157B596|nr:hypothetical protein [Marinoscillum sp. MHG1-6]